MHSPRGRCIIVTTQLAAQTPQQPRPNPRKKPSRASNAENANIDDNNMSMFQLRSRKLTPGTSKHAAKKNVSTVKATQNNLVPPKPSLPRTTAGNLLNCFDVTNNIGYTKYLL